jgi:CRISPR/Cas system CSM-associated protein Csm3 (group 7 of RAMP superfamily)
MRTKNIHFRVIFDSPARISGSGVGVPTLLGSTLKGLIRHCFRSYLGIEPGSADEAQLFGTAESRGRISLIDMRFEGTPEGHCSVQLDPYSKTAAPDSFCQEMVVPAGAMLLGAVAVDEAVTDRQITLLRAAMSSIEVFGIGAHRARGYGWCRVEFVDLHEVGRVFISYAWEDEEHNEWVLRLAERLTKEGVSTIFDRYDLSFGENVHVFMEQAIDRAAKVLLILTPTYKAKASARAGGVGFEFSMITSELFENLARNKKFVPVLRRGTRQTSIPKSLLPFRCCDMTQDRQFERKFSELYGAIVGNPPMQRPRSRFGNPDG